MYNAFGVYKFKPFYLYYGDTALTPIFNTVGKVSL